MLLYVPSGNPEITCSLWILFNTELIVPRHTLLHLHAFHSHFLIRAHFPYRRSAAFAAQSHRSAVLILVCGEGGRAEEQEAGWGSNGDNIKISFHDSLLCLQIPRAAMRPGQEGVRETPASDKRKKVKR